MSISTKLTITLSNKEMRHFLQTILDTIEPPTRVQKNKGSNNTSRRTLDHIDTYCITQDNVAPGSNKT